MRRTGPNSPRPVGPVDRHAGSCGQAGNAPPSQCQILAVTSEPLAYLIGRRDYARTLRWAMERTRRVNAPLAEFDDNDIAEICDVSPEDVRTTVLRLQSLLAPLLYRLYPVSCIMPTPSPPPRSIRKPLRPKARQRPATCRSPSRTASAETH
jgi:hypothetical protein